MLAESEKSSIGEVVDKLVKLDSIGMMIIMSNATALLARQEIEERKTCGAGMAANSAEKKSG